MIRQLIWKCMGRPELPPDATPEMLDPEAWDVADEAVRTQMIEALYPQLKRIAERHMQRERVDHTLQPTALVSEFFLILARQKKFTVNGRAHFLALASRAMRRLLIDHARSHGAVRHGGAAVNVELDEAGVAGKDSAFDMLELDELLTRLAGEEPRMARVVELKCFGGLTFEEIAHVLSVDERTAKRDWQVARAWLFGHLRRGKPDAS